MEKKEEKCIDKNCPLHGNLKARGRAFIGIVVSDKMSKTVTVEFIKKIYVPKYERYLKKKKKIHAHNPGCINASKGDKVKAMECRPLSKTKHFVITGVL